MPVTFNFEVATRDSMASREKPDVVQARESGTKLFVIHRAVGGGTDYWVVSHVPTGFSAWRFAQTLKQARSFALRWVRLVGEARLLDYEIVNDGKTVKAVFGEREFLQKAFDEAVIHAGRIDNG